MAFTLKPFRDDIIRAVKKLEVLGHGFKLVKLSDGNYLVQSVPGELVCILYSKILGLK